MIHPVAPRGFRVPRCSGCALTTTLCVCALWPPIAAPLSISVVMPPPEARSASGSARLLALWLPSASIYVRGEPSLPTSLPAAAKEASSPTSATEPSRRSRPIRFLAEPSALFTLSGSALLFPGASPSPLPAGVTHLIVPDGTWSQARRIERRWFAARHLPRVSLAPHWGSAYGLRRGGSSGLCTFEAAAIALGLLSDPTLAALLLNRFAVWATRARQLKAGGTWPSAPSPEAIQHPAVAQLASAAVSRPPLPQPPA